MGDGCVSMGLGIIHGITYYCSDDLYGYLFEIRGHVVLQAKSIVNERS